MSLKVIKEDSVKRLSYVSRDSLLAEVENDEESVYEDESRYVSDQRTSAEMM